ncbi:hypothetical protein VNO78_15160 [Psophocarpus tetragonolobus]|uniref:Uncharacterized protein n=1 Tax=Psophocarpus tetragonolobus TaxID=3891 RepID=A0AAN9SEF8_PSOTE
MIVNLVLDLVLDLRQQLNGRIIAYTVMKIVMQKVRLVEVNLSTFEDYIKELNRRQRVKIPNLEKELSRFYHRDESKKVKDLGSDFHLIVMEAAIAQGQGNGNNNDKAQKEKEKKKKKEKEKKAKKQRDEASNYDKLSILPTSQE